MSGVSGNDASLTQQIDICTTEWCNSDAIPNDVATTYEVFQSVATAASW